MVPMTMVKSWTKTWGNWGTKGFIHLIISYTRSINKRRWKEMKHERNLKIRIYTVIMKKCVLLMGFFPYDSSSLHSDTCHVHIPRSGITQIAWSSYINYQSRKHTIILLTGQLETFSKLRLFLPKLL